MCENFKRLAFVYLDNVSPFYLMVAQYVLKHKI